MKDSYDDNLLLIDTEKDEIVAVNAAPETAMTIRSMTRRISGKPMARSIPLYDERSRPTVWSDRMATGEFAVLCEDARTGAAKQPDNHGVTDAAAQLATICATRDEAEAFARAQVELYPTMRCLVFNHEGRAREPMLTVHRPEYAPRGEIGPRFRRWVGGVCLVAGLVCGVWEIAHDYTTIWAGTLAMRFLPVAAVFLGTELVLVAGRRWSARRSRS